MLLSAHNTPMYNSYRPQGRLTNAANIMYHITDSGFTPGAVWLEIPSTAHNTAVTVANHKMKSF